MGQCEPVEDSMTYENGQRLSLLQELKNAKENREHLKRMMTALESNQKAQSADMKDLARFKKAQKMKNHIFEGSYKCSILR